MEPITGCLENFTTENMARQNSNQHSVIKTLMSATEEEIVTFVFPSVLCLPNMSDLLSSKRTEEDPCPEVLACKGAHQCLKQCSALIGTQTQSR